MSTHRFLLFSEGTIDILWRRTQREIDLSSAVITRKQFTIGEDYLGVICRDDNGCLQAINSKKMNGKHLIQLLFVPKSSFYIMSKKSRWRFYVSSSLPFSGGWWLYVMRHMCTIENDSREGLVIQRYHQVVVYFQAIQVILKCEHKWKMEGD